MKTINNILTSLKSTLLVTILLFTCVSVWGGTTYDLKLVSSVAAGGKYVFVQDGHAAINTTSNSALQTTDTYLTKGLLGTESYVWTLETATDGYYYIKSANNEWLHNASSANLSLSTSKSQTTSYWNFTFDNNIALITNPNNSNRYLGYQTGGYAYKAYSSSGYACSVSVYQLVEAKTYTDYITQCAAPLRDLYLQLPSDWKAATAKYAIYQWGGAANGWSEWMTAETSCGETVYSGQVPEDATNVAFVRFNSDASEPGEYGKEWNRTGDLTLEAEKDFYQSISKGGDDKYYGSWDVYTQKMTVLFNVNEHGTTPDAQCVVKGGTVSSLPTPSASGFKFGGWFTDNNTFLNEFTTSTVVDADIEVFAKWTPLGDRTVYLKLNDDWAAATAKYAIYYFTETPGWSDFMTAGTGCNAGSYSVAIPETETKIIVARFDPVKQETGNWDNLWNQTVNLTLPVDKDLVTITTQVSGGDDNGKYNADMSVYALPTHTITFYAGDGSGSMDPMTGIECGSNAKLDANTFTAPTDKVFSGWATTQGGEKAYDNEATIENVTSDINLYALWIEDPNRRTVTFNAGTGSCTTESLKEPSAGAGVTLPTATAPNGWTFEGWHVGKVEETTTRPADILIAESNYKPNDNVTLHAVYSKTTGDARTYQKVTDLATITDGSTIVISVVGKTMKYNNNAVTTIATPTETDSKITLSAADDAACQWIVGKSNNVYTFSNATGKVGVNTLPNSDTQFQAFIVGTPTYQNYKIESTSTTGQYIWAVNNNSTSYYYIEQSNSTIGAYNKTSKPTSSAISSYYATTFYKSISVTTYNTTPVRDKILQSIAVKTPPTTTKYVVGEAFDATGTVLSLIYDEGDPVDATDGYTFTVNNLDANDKLTTKSNNVEFDYNGKKANQAITVGTLTSIAVTTNPTKTEYTEGETFNPDGMVVTGTYSNGAERQITNYTYEPTGYLQLGQTTITIKVGEISTTYNITINEAAKWTVTFDMNGTTEDKKVIKGWTLNEIPTPAEVSGFTFQGWVKTAISGETATQPTYDLTKNTKSYYPTEDVTFYAVYSRQDEVVVNGFKLSCSNVYVGGWNASGYLDDEDDIKNAEVFFLDGKYLYFYKDNTITYVYYSTSFSSTTNKSNAKEWNITDNETMVFASTTTTVKYLGYNSSYNRFAAYSSTYPHEFTKIPASKAVITNLYSTTAELPELQSIAITTPATKDTYFEGDDFEKAGMVVTATFNNGAKVLADNAYFISPSTNLQTSDKKVVVSYTYGEVTKTDDQDITVNAIELTKIELNTDNVQKTFMQNAEFNSTGLVVNAFFNDDRKDKQLADGYTVSTPDMTTTGEKTVTVSYTYKEGNTKTADYTIQVNSALTKITLNTDNVKKTYIETETFDPANMVVTATYGAGEPKAVTENITYYLGDDQITDETVLAGLNTLAASTVKTITVKYTEFGTTVSNTYDVTVNPYPRYSVTFMEKGVQKDVLTETQGQGGVTAPTATETIGEYTFVGWSTTNPETETTVKPELVTLTSGKYYPTENKTLYAIYSTIKATEVQGKKYQLVVNTSTYYISSFSSSSLYLTTTEADAMTLWFNDGFMRYYNSLYSRYDYIYFNSSLQSTNTKATAASYPWTKNVSGDKVYFVENGSSKVLSKNESSQPQNYMRCYVSSNNYPHLMTEFDGDKATFEVSNYTSMPDSRLKPEIKFTTATVNTPVLTDAAVHTSLATYTNNTLSTENTEGAKTFTLADGDEAVASINASTGAVTAITAGTVTVTVTIASTSDWYEGSASYSLTFDKMTPTVTFDNEVTAATVYTGGANTITLTASTNSDATVTYSSSNESRATISTEGVVTGVSASNTGTCTLYAGTAATDLFKATTNSTRASLTLTVKSNAKTQTPLFNQSSYEFANGATVEDFTNELTGAKTTVHYESNNTALATVNETSGLVHLVSTATPGTATITATAQAGDVLEEGVTYAYAAASATFTISVNYPKPVFSLAGGEYHTDQLLELSGTEVQTYYYTTNGIDVTFNPSTLESNGTEYKSGIYLEKGTTTVKAIAIYTDGDNYYAGAQEAATYNLVAPTAPAFSWTLGQKVTTSDVLTIECDNKCYIDYIVVDENGETVQKGGSNVSPVSINVSAMGEYSVEAFTYWKDTKKADSYKSDAIESSFTMQGPATLPYAYRDFKTKGIPGCFDNHTTGTYSATNTQLKFGAQGDYLVFQCNEQMNNLYYTVKHNPNGSTTFASAEDVFTVYTSTDGNSYIKLNEHTTMSSENEETIEITNIPTDARYIKWVYTTRGNNGGNVGLGNIKVGLLPMTFTSGINDMILKPNDMVEWTATVSADDYQGTITYTAPDNLDTKKLAYEEGWLLAYAGPYTANFTVTAMEDDRYARLTTTAPVEVCGTYTREASKFSAGTISTICLPNAVKADFFEGCTVYEVAGKELVGGEPYKVFFDQVFSLEAGKPYVIELNEGATQADFYYSGAAATAQTVNGLVGTFTAIDDATNGNSVLMGNYMIYSNQIKKCGTGCLVGKNKAYIVMDGVPEISTNPTPAPGRRRIVLGNAEVQTPTDMEMQNAECTMQGVQKMIIDNQLIIIRGGKMYNAAGALVK